MLLDSFTVIRCYSFQCREKIYPSQSIHNLDLSLSIKFFSYPHLFQLQNRELSMMVTEGPYQTPQVTLDTSCCKLGHYVTWKHAI